MEQTLLFDTEHFGGTVPITDRESVDLACLASIGDQRPLADGCDAEQLVRMGFIVRDASDADGIWRLTEHGATWLASLRANA